MSDSIRELGVWGGGGVGGWARVCTINAIFFIHASATEIILSYTDVYH